MSKIHIFKAQPVVDNESITDMFIHINRGLPDLSGERGRVLPHLFKEDARRLCDALFDSLPGGTIDALLIEMLEKKRSNLLVKAPS